MGCVYYRSFINMRWFMKAVVLCIIVALLALAGCVAIPTRVVYVPVPYIPAQGGTAQRASGTQAYVPPVYPVYQPPVYQMYPRNPGYCPGPWCSRQQFGYGGGYGGGRYFFFRHGHGGRW